MITLGTSWERRYTVLQRSGLPDIDDVLNLIERGRPIRVVGNNAADEIWLTPAAILTVAVRE